MRHFEATADQSIDQFMINLIYIINNSCFISNDLIMKSLQTVSIPEDRTGLKPALNNC